MNAAVHIRLLAICLALLSGCSLFAPVQLATKKEFLSQMPSSLPQRDRHAETLLVLPPETSPAFNTTQMAYRIRPYQIDYYAQSEWGATPAQMLHPLLRKTLEETGYFSGVIAPPYPSRYSYALRTEITDITQDFTSDSAALQLSLRVQLIDGGTGQIIATREIMQREPMQERTPYSGVVAANNATARALQEVAGFILEKIENNCSGITKEIQAAFFSGCHP